MSEPVWEPAGQPEEEHPTLRTDQVGRGVASALAELDVPQKERAN